MGDVQALARLGERHVAADPVLMTTTFDETLTLAGTLAKSGFFGDAREAAQAVVKVLAGRELGVGPIQAMTSIHVVKGKIGLAAVLMGALIRRSGRYDYRVVEHTDTVCELAFTDRGAEMGRSRFTLEDAKRARLGGDNWSGYPRNMLFSRAMSNGTRWYCPDIFGGAVYTPDELDTLPEPPPGVDDLRAALAGTAAAPGVVMTEASLFKGESVVENVAAPAAPGPAEGKAEKPPSYEPWGAITMLTELGGGRFTPKACESYFGEGIGNKSALEAMKASHPDQFRLSYDALRKDYQAGKAGPAAA